MDGLLADACWQEVPRSSGFTDDTLGSPVPDDTTIWLGYDEANLYVAFHCKDAQPSGIVAREMKRGAGFKGEDLVRLRINPFNSKRGQDESALTVNALGTQDVWIAGGRTAKQEWQGEWKSAARITEDGWTAEMAVPWRIFARPASSGQPVTVGLNFERYHARTDVTSFWSFMGFPRRQDLTGEWTGVVLPPAPAANPLSVLAYSYGGVEDGQGVQRAGLDARYQATPLLTGLATLNPDLSNIENAVTSIDFSYSERLPSESRPFFLEGNGYFGWGANGVNPFASVRVEELDLGGKFYGRVGKSTDVGLLTTQNMGDRNDSVMTMQHAFSAFDSLSFQAVTRMDDLVQNQVLAGKASARRGDWGADLSFIGARDRGPADDEEDDDDATDERSPLLEPERNGQAAVASLWWGKGAWSAWGNLSTISRDFVARNGYVPFVDQRGGGLGFQYETRIRKGWLREVDWEVNSHHFTRTDGGFFRGGLSTHLDFRTDSQWKFYFDISRGRFEDNRDRLMGLGVRYPEMNRFQYMQVFYNWGRQGGSDYASLSPMVNWRFFDRLSVGASVEFVKHEGTHYQNVLSLAYDVARDVGIGGRLVNRNGKVNGYLSLRRSGYGGTEAFLIVGDPNAEKFSTRMILKVVRPL